MTKEQFIQLVAEELEERARLDALDEWYAMCEEYDYYNHTLDASERSFDDYQDNLWED